MPEKQDLCLYGLDCELLRLLSMRSGLPPAAVDNLKEKKTV